MMRSTTMNAAGPSNPLHGITLETMLNQLVIHYGWEEMGNRINIRCFQIDPSIKSALKFLRTTLGPDEGGAAVFAIAETGVKRLLTRQAGPSNGEDEFG